MAPKWSAGRDPAAYPSQALHDLRPDRGQNFGPDGTAEFGEVEDYYLCHFGG
jgi:hypothetical protein